MRCQPLPLDTDYIVNEYRKGRGTPSLAEELGVSITLICRRLKVAGISIRSRRKPIPDAEIIASYLEGESENVLAHRFGVARSLIRRRIIEADVAPRGRSDAERLKWQQMSPTRRLAQVAPAHAACKGRVVSREEGDARALNRQQRLTYLNEAEMQLASMLALRGIDGVVLQQAVGPYNCDLGAQPVAVEIFGGKWHWHGHHLLTSPERLRYLLNAGWHVLVVVNDKRRHPLCEGGADYVATFIQEMRSDPSRRREYRVIRGACEVLAAGSVDDDEVSLIPAFRRRLNRRG